MKLAVLFSGGKDSTYAAYLAQKDGHELICLITVASENQDSYMFHTPSISATEVQAKAMNLPLLQHTTKGKKEEELTDLKEAIAAAKDEYAIEGLITGAVGSVYQASRIQKICDDFGLECVNPLWQKDQEELLRELVAAKFKIIITGIAAYPLGKEWLNRAIDEAFIVETKELYEKYKINPAGEGGEFESLVLDCPLFSKPLIVAERKISGEDNSWRMEVRLEFLS
ncbi:diphthine--ammonia ligase [Candidatus Woesearchaeota archaeon]|nr:diphthine--ammonia ligase [Candidatus Woesearchaeota archaeon]